MVRTRVTPHNKVSKARFQKEVSKGHQEVSKGHPPKGFQSSKAKFKGTPTQVSKGHPPGKFKGTPGKFKGTPTRGFHPESKKFKV